MVKTSATRRISPYKNLKSLQRIFNDTALLWGTSETPQSKSVQVSVDSYLRDTVSINFNHTKGDDKSTAFNSELEKSLNESITETGLTSSEVDFVISAKSSYLRLSEVLWRGTIDDLASSDGKIVISKDPRPGPFQTWSHGCEVTLVAVLNTRRAPAPLTPARKGTWLAKVQFRVDTGHGDSGFIPKALDDADRNRLGIRDNTIIYVQVDDPFDNEAQWKDTTTWVDGDLLALANKFPSTTGAQNLQFQIALRTFNAVIYEASRRLQNGDPSPEDMSGSPVGLLVKHLSGGEGSVDRSTLERWLEKIKSDPEKVIADVEDSLDGYRKQVEQSIGGQA